MNKNDDALLIVIITIWSIAIIFNSWYARTTISSKIDNLPKYKVYYEYNIIRSITNNNGFNTIKIDTIPVDTVYIKLK